MLGQERAQHTAPSEQHEQDISGDDRRKHQGQMDDAVEQHLAGKPPARQRIAGQQADWQTECRGGQRDLQRQADGRPFLGRKFKHRSAMPYAKVEPSAP